MRHGSGGLEGDSVAGEVFSGVYEPAGARWHEAATDPRLVAVCPFTDECVDTSLTVFADDLFRVILTGTCRTARVTLTVPSNDRDLGRELKGIGVAQHPGKNYFCGVFLVFTAAPWRESWPEVITSEGSTSRPLSI